MSDDQNLAYPEESFFSSTLPALHSVVCLRNRRSTLSLSLNTCHIGQIVKYIKLNDQPYCVVELYLRPETLPKKTDAQSFELDKFREVVEHCIPNLGQFLVQDIITPCEIISGKASQSVDFLLQEYNCNNPCFVLRFKLEESGEETFILQPISSFSEDKMALGKTEVLAEKGLNSGGKRVALSDIKGLKSPRQGAQNPGVCHEDVKENFAANSASKISKSNQETDTASCHSPRKGRPSKSTVRRSLVSDLDSPPVKQPRVVDDQKISNCVVMVEKVDTDSDTDSIWKDSWVSQLLDANIPIVENGRCPTPIRLSLKRIRPDITPSKVGPSLSLQRKPSCNDSDEDEEDVKGHSQSTRKSTAVTPSRRSARKTKCTISLMETMTDSDSEDVSVRKPRGAAAKSHTPKRKSTAPEPTVPRSTRRNSTWEDEGAKTPTSKRSRKIETPSEVKPDPEAGIEDLLSPLESRTPLSKRIRGKTPQPQESTAQEPKTPTSTRTRKSKLRTPSEKLLSEDEVEDSESIPESRTPSTRKRGKDPESPDFIPSSLRTPSRTPKTASKTPSKSPRTPRAKSAVKTPSKSALTPSMPARTTAPLTPMSSLEQIRKNLHVSAVPMSLPCRESEYRNIYNFLENKIRDAAGGCMYISGVPGTGKTATVNAVVRSLKKLVDAKKLKDFQYIETNGLRMTEPRQVFVQVLKALTGQKSTPQQAQDILAERFCSGSAKNKTVVLLVDEVDMLRNRRQDVIYNLFDWPSKPNSRFIVLTIANTMDLPERLLKGRVTSRLGLTRLTFQPYSYKQLQEIVLSRLQGSNSFNDDAVELVARKVAACSGDVRRALDICRRASEMVEEGNPVTMPIVNQVLSQMMNSANVCSIKACSRLEKLFLQAIVAENERTGVEETNFISVYRQFQSFCALSSVTLINVSEAMALLNRLGTSGLLLTEHSRADINQSIFLNVNADDIHYALNQTAPAS